MSEDARHAVSRAMDDLGDVADDAAVDDGRWNAAFKAAWVEIDALVAEETAALRAENERLKKERAELIRFLQEWDTSLGAMTTEEIEDQLALDLAASMVAIASATKKATGSREG